MIVAEVPLFLLHGLLLLYLVVLFLLLVPLANGVSLTLLFEI